MNEHEVLNRGIVFAKELLQVYKQNHDYSDTRSMVLVGLFRKIVELSDGVSVCAQEGLRGGADLNFRGLLEAYLSLKYILEDAADMENRAIAYKVGYHKHQIDAANHSIQNGNLSEEERVFFENARQVHERILENEEFVDVLEEWNNLQQNHRRNHAPKWHSLFGGPSSINALARRIDGQDTGQMERLYGLLSVNAHNYLVLRDFINTAPNVQVLADIRYPADDLSIYNLVPTRSLLTSAMFAFIRVLFPEYLEQFREFMNGIREYLVY
ncbi:hypothetical protein BK786_22560 [Bacillus thuringiensis serovar thailandensis]|nr:hypothetical protein BK786_22560 [Bacillus thuringiensis serovar thailandensis]